MKSTKVLALLVAAVFVFAGAAFAQDAPKADEPKPVVDVSGVLYLDWAYYNKTDSYQEGADNMRIQRAYLTFAKEIDKVWSAKVTLDGVGLADINEYEGEDTDVVSDGQLNEINASKKTNNVMFLKNAYVQMKQSFDPVTLTVQYGVVGTPIIGISDQMGGARWIYNTYMDKSKDIMDSTIDVSSADMGLKAEVSIMKMVSVTGMYSNGSTYKFTEDQQLSDKAYWGLLSITPIKGLFINGYYHTRDVAVDAADADEVTYYGGGLAWSDKSFKVGGNYVMGEKSSDTATSEADYTVYEIWANINLDEVVGMPILIYGKYAAGETDYNDGKKKAEGNTIYAGLGYQFNKSVQAMLLYQMSELEKTTNAGVKTKTENDIVWAKMEVKI